MAFEIPVGQDEGTLKPTYCSVGEVARVLGHDSLDGDYFPDGTGPNDVDNMMPTSEDIENVILEVEQEIDNYTRQTWRPTRVINEIHTISLPWKFTSGTPIHLRHRMVLPFDRNQGDSIKVWLYGDNGWAEFVDDVAEGTGGSVHTARNLNWWLDGPVGVLHLHSKRPLNWEKGLMITYRYQVNATPAYDETGADTTATITLIPYDIKRATRLLAAAFYVVQNDTTQFVIDGTDRVSLQNKAKMWEEKAYELLQQYKEILYVRD